MSMVVHLPDELVAQLEGEAARRGVTVEELTVEAVRRLYCDTRPADATDALEAFVGIGSSGDATPVDIRQARRDLAERKLAEGA